MKSVSSFTQFQEGEQHQRCVVLEKFLPCIDDADGGATFTAVAQAIRPLVLNIFIALNVRYFHSPSFPSLLQTDYSVSFTRSVDLSPLLDFLHVDIVAASLYTLRNEISGDLELDSCGRSSEGFREAEKR